MFDLKAANRTGVVFFPAFDWAISPTHPEREERLLYTRDQIFEEGLFDIEGVVELDPLIADKLSIERVHDCYPDPETLVTDSHLISAGGAMRIGKAVTSGEIERGFALVRPPGHHAMRVVRGLRGFCIVNIEAMMIEDLRASDQSMRVAIVDTDCHHGDGTQDIYWNDPNTLFFSIHQDGRTLYPGSGFPEEAGGPNGWGTTINIPLPPNTGDEGLLYVVDNVIRPILDEWQPDLTVNSAGQDNHFTDPITNMSVSAIGYAELTRRLKAQVAVLEGGYSVQTALPYVNTGILLAMAGLDTSHVVEPDFQPHLTATGIKTMEYIKKLSDALVDRFRKREELGGSALHGREVVVNERNVFHDEAGISENQVERVRVCSYCAGAVILESRVGNRQSLGSATIPLNSCSKCRSFAEDCYRELARRDFEIAILRDRPADSIQKSGLTTG